MIRRKSGAVSFLALLIIVMVVSTVLGINEIKKNVFKLMEEQNRKDAHMFSVIGLYKETLDTVTWCNKQLKRLGYLAAMLSVFPGANALASSVNVIGQGITRYQDFVLMRLRIYAPILDLSLRQKNSLNGLPNYHNVSYRRRTGFSILGLFKIPPLIELKNDVFSTACVKHKGFIINTSVCVDHKEYKNERSIWFAPTDGVWEVVIKNAY